MILSPDTDIVIYCIEVIFKNVLSYSVEKRNSGKLFCAFPERCQFTFSHKKYKVNLNLYVPEQKASTMLPKNSADTIYQKGLLGFG